MTTTTTTTTTTRALAKALGVGYSPEMGVELGELMEHNAFVLDVTSKEPNNRYHHIRISQICEQLDRESFDDDGYAYCCVFLEDSTNHNGKRGAWAEIKSDSYEVADALADTLSSFSGRCVNILGQTFNALKVVR